MTAGSEQVVSVRLTGDGKGLEAVVSRNTRGIKGLGGETQKTSGQLKKGARDAQDFGRGMGSASLEATALRAALRLVGPAVVAMGFKKAADDARSFSAAMAEVTTLADFAYRDIGLLKDQVRELAVQFNQTPEAEAKALYDIISAGASSSEEAITLLTQANKLAVGGVTSVSVAADGLTSILNAYGDAAGGAENVSDAMFVTMRSGKTTIAELSGEIGKVAPLAATAGVGLEALLAAIAALTKGGIETNVAVTGLRAILAAVVKPSAEAADRAKELGLEFSTAAIQSKGFAGFLRDVVEKTGGADDQLGILFQGVEALVPILALAGNAGEDFTLIVEAMLDKLGETEKAFNRNAGDDSFKIEQLFGRLADEALGAGEAINQGLVPAAETIFENFDDIKEIGLDVIQMMGILATTAGAAAGFRLLASTISPAIIGLRMMSGVSAAATTQLVAQAAATGALAIAQRALFLAGGPLGVAAIALGSAYVLLSDASDEAEAAAERQRQALFRLSDEMRTGIDLTRQTASEKLTEARGHEAVARAALLEAQAKLQLSEDSAKALAASGIGDGGGVHISRAGKLREEIQFLLADLDIASDTVAELERRIAELEKPTGESGGNGSGGAGGGDNGTMGDLAAELEAVLKAADPIGAALQDYTDAAALLDQGLKSGLIPSTAEHTRLQEGLDAALAKTLSKTPAAKIEAWARAQTNLATRTLALKVAEDQRSRARAEGSKLLDAEIAAMAEEVRLARLSEEQRQVEIKTREILNRAKQEGVSISEAEARAAAEAGVAALRAAGDQQRYLSRWQSQFKAVVANFETGFKDAFKEAFRETGGGFDRLMEGFEQGFLDMLAEMAFQAFAKPIIVPVLQQIGTGFFGLSGGQVNNVLGQQGLGGGGLGTINGVDGPINVGAGGFDLSSLTNLFSGGGIGGLGFSQGIGNLGVDLAQLIGGGAETQAIFGNAFARGGSPAGIAGGFAGNFLANTLLGDRGIGASIGGTIGAIAGSFIPIPFVGTALGSLFGNAVGGLFGNNRPSVGQVIGARFGADGGVLATGVDNGGSSAAAQEFGSQISNILDRILNVTGAAIENEFIVEQSQRNGLMVNRGGGRAQTFGDDLVAALQFALEGNMAGGDPVFKNLFASANVGNIEELVQLLESAEQFKATLDGLTAANDNLTTGEQAIKTLTEQMEALREQAVAFGFSVAQINAAEAIAQDRLAEDFNDGISTALLNALDPVRASAVAMLEQQEARVRDTLALGGDLAQVEKLNLLQRRDFLRQLTEEQRAGLSDLIDLTDDFGASLAAVEQSLASAISDQLNASNQLARAYISQANNLRRAAESLDETRVELRFSDTSTLTPAQQLAEARALVDALRDDALAGDEDALAELPDAVKRFIEASAGFNANNATFAADFDEMQALLAEAATLATDTADIAETQVDLLSEQSGLLQDILGTLSSPSPDANLLQTQLAELTALNSQLDAPLMFEGFDGFLDGQARAEDLLGQLVSLAQTDLNAAIGSQAETLAAERIAAIETASAKAIADAQAAAQSQIDAAIARAAAAEQAASKAEADVTARYEEGVFSAFSASQLSVGRNAGRFVADFSDGISALEAQQALGQSSEARILAFLNPERLLAEANDANARVGIEYFLRDLGVPGFAGGGHIQGAGTKTSDSIPIMASDGEFVIQASAVDQFGVDFFNSLNAGVTPAATDPRLVSEVRGLRAGLAQVAEAVGAIGGDIVAAVDEGTATTDDMVRNLKRSNALNKGRAA